MNVRGFHRPSGYGKGFIRPLRNTAVDQDIQFTGLKKMTGTRNTFFSPKMGNLKNIDSLSCCYVFFAQEAGNAFESTNTYHVFFGIKVDFNCQE